MEPFKMPQRNTTMFLILSDTPAGNWTPPNTSVDVAIHCGELTQHSTLNEFKHAIRMMSKINADLKLVIAGDHDWTLDNTTGIYRKRLVEARVHGVSEAAFIKQFGAWGEARRLLFDAARAGIAFLDEGRHSFHLSNGAHLELWASPYTPSTCPHLPDGGFRHHADRGHPYSIGDDVNVVVTHSPRKGVLDRTSTGTHAGGGGLFQALEQAHPRMHCFGYVREGWGAHLLDWRDDRSSRNVPCAVTAVGYDKHQSYAIESLETLTPLPSDKEETRLQKKARNKHYDERNFVYREQPVVLGEETLFVNAAVKASQSGSRSQVPWVVDIELSTMCGLP
ncbi:ser/Thr protein phosphatase family protein [Coniochaeta sp. 2T2.1]|nr:ser/Thr protein phosphatase family protein [Coniochaeta sp. 2T2.1]